ncbi:hypothetical protein Tco_0278210 [Tanacetum coccineum]
MQDTEEASSMAFRADQVCEQHWKKFERFQMMMTQSHLLMKMQKGFECWLTTTQQMVLGVNTPGSDENRLKLYVLMYNIVKVADTRVKDYQMHNNIMAAGSRDRPPMLATGRYAQWRSRFLRYIDTRPNGDALRKCILTGPYIPTMVTTPAVPATEDSPE